MCCVPFCSLSVCGVNMPAENWQQAKEFFCFFSLKTGTLSIAKRGSSPCSRCFWRMISLKWARRAVHKLLRYIQLPLPPQRFMFLPECAFLSSINSADHNANHSAKPLTSWPQHEIEARKIVFCSHMKHECASNSNYEWNFVTSGAIKIQKVSRVHWFAGSTSSQGMSPRISCLIYCYRWFGLAQAVSDTSVYHLSSLDLFHQEGKWQLWSCLKISAKHVEGDLRCLITRAIR